MSTATGATAPAAPPTAGGAGTPEISANDRKIANTIGDRRSPPWNQDIRDVFAIYYAAINTAADREQDETRYVYLMAMNQLLNSGVPASIEALRGFSIGYKFERLNPLVVEVREKLEAAMKAEPPVHVAGGAAAAAPEGWFIFKATTAPDPLEAEYRLVANVLGDTITPPLSTEDRGFIVENLAATRTAFKAGNMAGVYLGLSDILKLAKGLGQSTPGELTGYRREFNEAKRDISRERIEEFKAFYDAALARSSPRPVAAAGAPAEPSRPATTQFTIVRTSTAAPTPAIAATRVPESKSTETREETDDRLARAYAGKRSLERASKAGRHPFSAQEFEDMTKWYKVYLDIARGAKQTRHPMQYEEKEAFIDYSIRADEARSRGNVGRALELEQSALSELPSGKSDESRAETLRYYTDEMAKLGPVTRRIGATTAVPAGSPPDPARDYALKRSRERKDSAFSEDEIKDMVDRYRVYRDIAARAPQYRPPYITEASQARRMDAFIDYSIKAEEARARGDTTESERFAKAAVLELPRDEDSDIPKVTEYYEAELAKIAPVAVELTIDQKINELRNGDAQGYYSSILNGLRFVRTTDDDWKKSFINELRALDRQIVLNNKPAVLARDLSVRRMEIGGGPPFNEEELKDATRFASETIAAAMGENRLGSTDSKDKWIKARLLVYFYAKAFEPEARYVNEANADYILSTGGTELTDTERRAKAAEYVANPVPLAKPVAAVASTAAAPAPPAAEEKPMSDADFKEVKKIAETSPTTPGARKYYRELSRMQSERSETPWSQKRIEEYMHTLESVYMYRKDGRPDLVLAYELELDNIVHRGSQFTTVQFQRVNRTMKKYVSAVSEVKDVAIALGVDPSIRDEWISSYVDHELKEEVAVIVGDTAASKAHRTAYDRMRTTRQLVGSQEFQAIVRNPVPVGFTPAPLRVRPASPTLSVVPATPPETLAAAAEARAVAAARAQLERATRAVVVTDLFGPPPPPPADPPPPRGGGARRAPAHTDQLPKVVLPSRGRRFNPNKLINPRQLAKVTSNPFAVVDFYDSDNNSNSDSDEDEDRPGGTVPPPTLSGGGGSGSSSDNDDDMDVVVNESIRVAPIRPDIPPTPSPERERARSPSLGAESVRSSRTPSSVRSTMSRTTQPFGSPITAEAYARIRESKNTQAANDWMLSKLSDLLTRRGADQLAGVAEILRIQAENAVLAQEEYARTFADSDALADELKELRIARDTERKNGDTSDAKDAQASLEAAAVMGERLQDLEKKNRQLLRANADLQAANGQEATGRAELLALLERNQQEVDELERDLEEARSGEEYANQSVVKFAEEITRRQQELNAKTLLAAEHKSNLDAALARESRVDDELKNLKEEIRLISEAKEQQDRAVAELNVANARLKEAAAAVAASALATVATPGSPPRPVVNVVAAYPLNPETLSEDDLRHRRNFISTLTAKDLLQAKNAIFAEVVEKNVQYEKSFAKVVERNKEYEAALQERDDTNVEIERQHNITKGELAELKAKHSEQLERLETRHRSEVVSAAKRAADEVEQKNILEHSSVVADMTRYVSENQVLTIKLKDAVDERDKLIAENVKLRGAARQASTPGRGAPPTVVALVPPPLPRAATAEGSESEDVGELTVRRPPAPPKTPNQPTSSEFQSPFAKTRETRQQRQERKAKAAEAEAAALPRRQRPTIAAIRAGSDTDEEGDVATQDVPTTAAAVTAAAAATAPAALPPSRIPAPKAGTGRVPKRAAAPKRAATARPVVAAGSGSGTAVATRADITADFD
jgi:hypothetical protein